MTNKSDYKYKFNKLIIYTWKGIFKHKLPPPLIYKNLIHSFYLCIFEFHSQGDPLSEPIIINNNNNLRYTISFYNKKRILNNSSSWIKAL